MLRKIFISYFYCNRQIFGDFQEYDSNELNFIQVSRKFTKLPGGIDATSFL
jgi:hypothetical protein